MQPELNERATFILNTLIQSYIRSGEPVGSKTLVAESGISLSPATVRSVLADLESQGLIVSPHPSAGRVPTAKGYRFFVDSYIRIGDPDPSNVQEWQHTLDGHLTGAWDRDRLLEKATRLLSDMTQCAAVVCYPKTERAILRYLEFLPLSENRILVVLVVNDYLVENRIFQADRPYERAELERVSAYLNQCCAGRDLLEIRTELLDQIARDLSDLQGAIAVMQQGLQVAQEMAHKKTRSEELAVFGQGHLLPLAESQGLASISALYQAFSEKKQIMHVLESCLSAQGVQIFIGEESGYAPLHACSLIATHYEDGSHALGVLGVIGPKRLPYDRVIPVVEMTAKCLSAVLHGEH